MNNLTSYTKIVGKHELDEIHAKAEKLSGKHILCINSTYQGGGVAEILNSMVPLFDNAGIDFAWHSRLLHHNQEVS